MRFPGRVSECSFSLSVPSNSERASSRFKVVSRQLSAHLAHLSHKRDASPRRKQVKILWRVKMDVCERCHRESSCFKSWETRNGRKGKTKHAVVSPDSLTPHQTRMCPPFKETWIALIPSLIKITYIKECVSLHQGFHLLYNEVNAETQWLPQQCKWRPNDNLHYLNKVIAITPRYSNEDGGFELSALNSLLLLQNIWKGWRMEDWLWTHSVCVSSNSMWCKPRATSEAKSPNVAAVVQGWVGSSRERGREESRWAAHFERRLKVTGIKANIED